MPAATVFRTKPQFAPGMVERALTAGVPAAWVTHDEIYGGDRRLRVWLEVQDMPNLLAVKRTELLVAKTVRGPAQLLATDLVALPAAAWQCRSAGKGAQGPRLYDWARLAIRPLSDPERGYWLLVLRSLADPAELAQYVSFGPANATLADLVRMAGTRWAIEQAIEASKGDVGLDHHEMRRWDGWYRHVTLCLLAHAFLAITRALVVGDKKGASRQPICHR